MNNYLRKNIMLKKFSQITLQTSNPFKIQEFNDMGLNIGIKEGEDIKEIATDDYHLIAAYKAKEAGELVIVEDSILIVEDQVFFDIKYKLKEIIKNIDFFKEKKATWVTTLAFMFNEKIYIFSGYVYGNLNEVYKCKDNYNVFAFDTIFYTKHNNKMVSLQELKEKGLKDEYSARVLGVKKMISFLNSENEQFCDRIYEANIKKWEGDYQAE